MQTGDSQAVNYVHACITMSCDRAKLPFLNCSIGLKSLYSHWCQLSLNQIVSLSNAVAGFCGKQHLAVLMGLARNIGFS